MRFVLVSFAFLFWAFYELSGGADFQPRGVRPQPPAPRITAPAPNLSAPIKTAKLATTPAIAPRRVPAAAPDPSSAQQKPGTSTPARESIAQISQSGMLSRLRVSGPNEVVSFASQDGGIASLGDIAANSANVAPQQAKPLPVPVAPAPDLREVIGTRVNMRDGPGTIYPVVARLQIGQKIEVLDTSGTGWLRIRTQATGTVGWVAASLTREPE